MITTIETTIAAGKIKNPSSTLWVKSDVWAQIAPIRSGLRQKVKTQMRDELILQQWATAPVDRPTAAPLIVDSNIEPNLRLNYPIKHYVWLAAWDQIRVRLWDIGQILPDRHLIIQLRQKSQSQNQNNSKGV